MSHKRARHGHRVLITAPFGRDAESVATLLDGDGYASRICADLDGVAAALDDDTGAILLTEEALRTEFSLLAHTLETQPPWSDVPFILLSLRQAGYKRTREIARLRLAELTTNLIVMERPLGSVSLLSAVAAAMRSRQKQFEMRDRLAELAAERNRLDTLLENLPVGVNFMDAAGQTVLSNPAFRRFLPDGIIPSRHPDGEARWIGFTGDGHRLDRDQFSAARALRGEPVAGIEFLYQPPQGASVWTRVSGVPLRDASGSVTGAISVIVDIDEQKRAQEALRGFNEALEKEVGARTAALEQALSELQAESAERARAEAALRQSQKMEAVGQLTGGIAHDFNNMLTGIVGSIDIMRRRIASGRINDLDRFMTAASISAQRAAALTQRLLAFSRRQSLDSKPLDVNALVASLEDLLERTISERISLDIALGDDIPPGIADANQLESAILNLVINGRDAMPDGGQLVIETGTVELDREDVAAHAGLKPGRYVTITVSDTGVGMAPELVDKVFEPFFSTKPLGQGTGLGLSMVYGFVRQSGGQVVIRSRPGEGTSVELFLPAAAAGMGQVQPQGAPETVPRGDGQAVLVVEDDESVRLLIREVLEELGYMAIEASEAQLAILMLASPRDIDLMISDVGLPGMNGRQLAEVARQHRPDLPILFVTGYAENAAIRSGFLGTNMAMVTKPFALETLAAKIGEMLTSGPLRMID
ncbi:MAG TPA: ATP-binding protein [Aliidongia sp.]|nr:ATP-binding protein [Aliidongia sp.]